MKSETISREELVTLLENIKKPTVVTLYTKTSSKLGKLLNDVLGEVYTFRNYTAMLHFDKDKNTIAACQQYLDNEMFDQSEPRDATEYLSKYPKWAKHLCGPLMTTKKRDDELNNKIYLRLMQISPVGKNPISYRNKKGHKVAYEDVKSNIAATAKVKNPFVYFLLGIENIKTIKIDKQVYKIK